MEENIKKKLARNWFLTIQELAKLEQTNLFLFNMIRKNPNCIISLNYSEWQSFLTNQNIHKIGRLSSVKSFLLPSHRPSVLIQW